MPDRTFEDFRAGQVFELGSRAVREAEIVEFARQWDPQPFHLDPEEAAASVFGGLIASGWHTCAIWMRLYADAVLRTAASRGSPGVEEIRWLAPVRPGDVLRGRLTVLDTAPSASRADRGTVRLRGELSNQHRVTVLSLVARGHFGRRQP